MGWRDLLEEKNKTVIAPWVGGRNIFAEGRKFRLIGNLPEEHGWYCFDVIETRKVRRKKEFVYPDFDWHESYKKREGYLVGDKLIPDDANFVFKIEKIFSETISVDLVEPGLDRFTRILTAEYENGRCLYVGQEFPLGPETEVMDAFQDRKKTINDIPNVTPALALAFRFESWRRALIEEERRKADEERQKRERCARLLEAVGTGPGRRAMANIDFRAACEACLSVSGAEYLDHRVLNGREAAVKYRFRGRRLECVINRDTFRIIDAGVCLDDHMGTRGDTFFTLESLPAVINEAINTGRLVVWRHG